uniref:G-patch domain-containing protein n=1 Tax=Neogobius melanostomus TaxID=47308 RepID=A0A8C6V3H6_9GOBI
MATLGFTRASDPDVFGAAPQHSSPAPSSCTLTGHEVRQFYEDLLKDAEGASAKSEKQHRRRKQKDQTRRVRRRRDGTASGLPLSEEGRVGSSGSGDGEGGDGQRGGELQGLRLLRCAHEGDTSALKDMLSKGADINFQDSYWWTGLMCASWAGHRAAVRLLLQRGAAWVGVVDLQGRDAMDLAMEAGHEEVVEEFDSFGTRPTRNSRPAKSAPCLQRCEVCDTSYTGPASSHLSSTLHQFNLRRPPPTPHYCLPASNAGYRMMLRSGWAPGSGLGPGGSGAHQPVPTVLKRDTLGLGFGRSQKAKVTHFKAGDTQAVQVPEKWRKEGERGERAGGEEGGGQEEGAERQKLGERLQELLLSVGQWNVQWNGPTMFIYLKSMENRKTKVGNSFINDLN